MLLCVCGLTLHCVCTCVWYLCLSFVFLSQIEPDSYVHYPVMEPGGTDKEKSRRADGATVLLHVHTFHRLSCFDSVVERSNYRTG